MIRFSALLGLLAIGLSACDSEGIDRPSALLTNPQVTPSLDATGGNPAVDSESGDSESQPTVSTQAGGDAQNDNAPQNDPQNNDSNAQPIVVPPPVNDSSPSNDNDAEADDINLFGGSGSSDGGQNSPEVNPGTSDDDANDINMFGGSGSSDGGENSPATPEQTDPVTDNTPDASNPTPPVNGEDTSISLQAPTTGTRFISTTSPVHHGGPECSFPNKDENNNLIFNDNCPTVSRAGNVAFGDFLLSNNTWNDCASAFKNWSQCISVDDSSGTVKARWDYDWGNETDVRGAVYLVKSYPEVIYGVKSPGEFSASSLAETVVATGMPAKVSDLPFYQISYTASSEEFPTRSKVLNGQTINGERNIAIESFFHELDGDCDVNTLVRNGMTSNQRFELMVWVDAGAERLPAAPNDYVTTTSIDGQQYDVYTKPSDREYIAFVATQSRNSADLNWNSFIEWSREYSHRVNEVFGRGSNTVEIQDDWCLANILLGTEIWWGNGFFQLDDYTIQRTER